MRENEHRLSERIAAAPFGRYQAGDEVEPPAQRVLVAREGQRAYFIDLLLRMGGRGAYLVTGRRGVGKTSFVRYCLSEYQQEVFKRFLHSNVGRVTFWDRAGVLLLGLIAIFGVLLISEFTEILALSMGRQSETQPNILLWLVLAPLVLVCLYPLLFAREVYEEIIEACWPQRTYRLDAAVATSVTLFLASLTWILSPFGAPALSMSRLFLGTCVLCLWVQSTSFNRPSKDTRRFIWLWRSLTTLLVVFIFACIYGWTARILPIPEVDAELEFKGNNLWAIILLGTGFLVRGLHLLRHFKVPASEQKVRLGKKIFLTPQFWYLATGSGLVIFPLIYLWLENLCWAMAGAAATLIAGLVAYLVWGDPISSAAKPISFHPQPLLILGAKAFICMVVALQLVHPVLSKWTWPRLAVDPERFSEVNNDLRSPISLHEISGISRNQQGAASREQSDTVGSAVFLDRYEELRWVLALFLALLTVYVLEYEWIVRPFVVEREEPSINPSRFSQDWKDQQLNLPGSGPRQALRNLARITLPWMLHKAWLPVLVISVNLGFERLDHRRVVHAMLAGLREQFHRAFLAWNSGLANLGRLLGLLLLMMVVTLTGDRWFNLPPVLKDPPAVESATVDSAAVTLLQLLKPKTEATRINEIAANDYRNICDAFEGGQRGPGIVNVICKFRWGNQIFHILYYDLLYSTPIQHYGNRTDHLLFYVFPYREESWPIPEDGDPETPPPLLKEGIHFRVYNLILILFFFVVGRWLLHRLPAIPYQAILNRIDEVMDNLAARTSVTSTTGRWKPAQWLQGFFVDERVRQTEQDPVDPRTIEFVFLQILRDIQDAAIQLPGGRNQLISLPTPEITFVFDELDKLGTRIDPDETTGGSAQQVEILHTERKRSMELHKLLADMKNLLSSAPARFIFVGGRNLHDEWLADQTARQPLLTNIFNAEVYLPSLLTDHSDFRNRRLHLQVEAYVYHQMVRAATLFSRSLNKKWLPSVALPLQIYSSESFVAEEDVPPVGPPSAECGQSLSSLMIVDLGKTGGECEIDGARELRRDLVQFLTYRSMGNPKRLKELLGTFVRPVGRVVSKDSVTHRKYFAECDHVLSFGDTERFRIQLLARIYRHLAMTFEQGLVRRDDKLAVSVFFLADFLFKFHRRAFSWSNLERVDELVHIHRAPDLREVLEEIVVQWSERFLHRIRNGMYDFRFRSDLAREVEYISRQSHEEMAAFNFTLDESQALKSVYESAINRFKVENTREIQDLLAGLGELHEFDQEYETARFYYRRAIASLDIELQELIGGSKVFESASPAIHIMGGQSIGRDHARLCMTWGITRLRLMLQVGMTFELSRNLERAEVEYRDARTLARSLLLAMLDTTGRERALLMDLLEEGIVDTADRLHALKHLNLIYQPVFAEAWIAEKLSGGVDTSAALIEKDLWEIRNLLPFVREPKVELSINPAKVKSSNFALIVSELHNKAGDLYFFKGRQPFKLECLADLEAIVFTEVDRTRPRRGQEGYLLRAHYHYAVGLHELRRFATHRRLSSRYKLNIWSGKIYAEPWETIARGGWSDFIYRAAGGTFNDCAEVMLGRVSLFVLFKSISSLTLEDGGDGKDISSFINDFVFGCTQWIERAPTLIEPVLPAEEEEEAEEIDEPNTDGRSHEKTETERKRFDIKLRMAGKVLRAGTLGGWLGQWNVAERDPSASNWKLILFSESSHHDDIARFPVALIFTLVGAKFLEKGGYVEDAAREHLKVCETVTYYLWWALGFKRIADWGYLPAGISKLAESLWPSDTEEADGPTAETKNAQTYWAYLIEVALYSLREADALFRRSRREEEVVEKAYLFGDKIPTAALTLACSLGLVLYGWNQATSIKEELSDLLRSWLGNRKDDQPFELSQDSLRELLERSLVRHSYPMINRLQGLKVLIDDAVLVGNDWTFDTTAARTQELLDLAANLNSPLHFTPLHSGVTSALVYLKHFKGEEHTKIERIRAAAKRDLSDSEEMYTLRRAYYENIADLFYLYDDFNDRQIHFNHAVQMAGAEFASLLMCLASDPRGPAEPSVGNSSGDVATSS